MSASTSGKSARSRPVARSRSASPCLLFSSKYDKAEARKIKLMISNRRAADANTHKTNAKLESNECWKRSLNAAINKPQDNKKSIKDRPVTRTIRQKVDRPHKSSVFYKLDEPEKIQIKRRDGEGKRPVFEYLTPPHEAEPSTSASNRQCKPSTSTSNKQNKPSTSASNKQIAHEKLSTEHRSRERNRQRTRSSSSSSSSSSQSSTSSDERTKKSTSRFKSRSYKSNSPSRKSRSDDRSHRSSSRRRNNERDVSRRISPEQPYFSNTAREHDRIRNKYERIRSLRSRSRSRERRLEDRRRSESYPMYPVQAPYFPYGSVVINPSFLQPAGPRPFFPPPHFMHPSPGYFQYPAYMPPPPFRYRHPQQRGDLRPRPPPWEINFRPRYF